MAKSRRVGRKRGDYAVEPGDLTLVCKIIYMREELGMTWREIGPELGVSHQAPYLVYRRWRLGKQPYTYEQYRAWYERRKKNGKSL